jgi:small multidrug resistance family-3 protein
MINLVWFFLAAVCEIAGCFTLWMWLRLGRSPLWMVPGTLSLVIFAILLTRVDSEMAGRAYAAYGGIYIVISLVWLAVVERSRPVWTDYLGAVLCILGAAVLLAGRP